MDTSDPRPPSPATPDSSVIALDAPPPTAKPRSAKPKPRSPSPSPPPPPPPAPLQTLRLHISLGGPDNYAVDVADIARAAGQRPPTPTIVITTAHSDSDDDDVPADKDKPKEKKKKKKNPTYEQYDVSDPFIDDSELAIDQRTYFGQTKQQGFYVSSGEVALLKDKTPKKPKSKNAFFSARPTAASAGKKPATVASASAPVAGAGKKAHAHAHDEEQHPAAGPSSVSDDEGKSGAQGAGAYAVGDPRTGEKRKRYVTVMEGGKKRKIVDINTFHPQIQAEAEKLRELVAKENWEQKGKFPPSLKPHLADLAILAIKLDEYDDHFFNLMPMIFPYNKFTMSKLIKRTVYTDHVALLVERQEALLAELAVHAKAGFPKAQEEWEKSVLAWDKRQEKLRLEGASASGTGNGNGTDSAGPPTRHPTEEMDVDPAVPSVSAGPISILSPATAEHDAESKDKDKEKDKDKDGKDKDLALAPPGKKYRLTEGMKSMLWQLVLLSNECCRLENEKNTLEGSVIQVSEQGLRKVLYQKIVAAFPEGWLSSGQISRDGASLPSLLLYPHVLTRLSLRPVSAMKKRFEREAMEQEQEGETDF
ncbi:hypothetical protein H0H87_009775 [Tephrocybe sp. NHM501043]|nr:hypothetical protein H0H87_009775 [Tephrocybe sp. NHM501043]